jgi:hypothetical protein
VTAQHGKGSYVIEQEVLFRDGSDSIIIKENWYVTDGSEMRVQATGPGLKLFRLLKHKRVYWVDGGSERADLATDDYFMSPLLTRNILEEKRIFNHWGVLPESALQDKRQVRDVKQIKSESESFVRLSRIGGTINYAYGQPTPVTGPVLPGLWIEQDEFFIRKMRSPSGAEFVGNEYAPYSKNLWLPRSQIITFSNHVATIRVINVASVDFSNEQKKQLDSSWIRNRPEAATVWPKSNLSGQVQEFYKRFR